MALEAKVTSKGQITLPKEVRDELGIVEGDGVRFVRDKKGMRVVPVHRKDRFEEFRGIGTPGIAPGLDAVIQYVRDLRGHDDLD